VGLYDRLADWPRRAAELPVVPPPHGVLLADPADFAVLEIHNPHMAGARGEPHRVDADAARAEWLQLAGAYSGIGQRVEVLVAPGGLPDLCFAANPSLLLPLPEGCEVWLARMVHPSRRGEIEVHRRWYAAHGYPLRELPTEVKRCEGGGDGVPHPGRHLLHAGVGPRSERAAWAALAAAHPALDVLVYELKDPRFYHLDTALAALDEETCLYVPEAFDAHGVALLRAAFPEAIAVPHAEAMNFAANAHCPDGRHVLLPRGNPFTERALKQRGFTPMPLETAEFQKSGGSVYCLKQALYPPPAAPRIGA
jgi:N-dimethylarginine dimethylaminohydrolase